MKRLLAATAGVPHTRLAEHDSDARWLVYAIGMALLFVTLPLAYLGMSVYASANLIDAAWPAWQQQMVVIGAALAWALMVVFGVDRTMLIMSDAINPDRWWATAALLVLRLGIAFVLSSLVADEIILWRYRAPIAEAAAAIALETRTSNSDKLDGLHGIVQKTKAVDDATHALDTLRAERSVLPTEIQEKFASVKRCQAERDTLSRRVTDLRAQMATTSNSLEVLTRARQRLTDKQRECKHLAAAAVAARQTYQQQKDAAIADAGAELRQVQATQRETQVQLDTEKARVGAATVAAWQDGSSREAAFVRVKAERPDIQRNAFLLWLALLLLELLPLLAKLFAHNNPVSAATRQRLQTESASYRMLATESARFESIWAKHLVNDPSTQDQVQKIMTMQHAGAPLAAFEHLLDQIEQSRRRLQRVSRQHDSSHTEVTVAFCDAQTAAFRRLSESY